MHKIAASALSIRTLFFDDETVTLVVPASGELPVHVEDGTAFVSWSRVKCRTGVS